MLRKKCPLNVFFSKSVLFLHPPPSRRLPNIGKDFCASTSIRIVYTDHLGDEPEIRWTFFKLYCYKMESGDMARWDRTGAQCELRNSEE